MRTQEENTTPKQCRHLSQNTAFSNEFFPERKGYAYNCLVMSQITRKDSCVRNDAVLIGSRAHNFPESIRQLELGKDKHVVNGDFLDEFYHAPKDQRQSFIDFEPPQSPSQTADRYFYAYCAAEAEKLAHDFNLTVPLWVERQYFFLEKP
ncbi:MAG: hypothetical protein FWD72_02970, partial [Eggerthellaceae bacterium]|nr:hypothetical protein [Eggerthellaceae bacterium]